MGLALWPNRTEDMADTVTAVALPDGLTDSQVTHHAREHYGVMLSAGEGAGSLVRIGHMAGTARSMHPVVGLLALGQTLCDLGHPVDVGAGAAAAMAVLAAA
jgi:pyridoxamine--pyruvate transaminase